MRGIAVVEDMVVKEKGAALMQPAKEETREERDCGGRWLCGYKRRHRQPMMTWLEEEEECKEGDAGSIVQAAILTTAEGEKGDGSGIQRCNVVSTGGAGDELGCGGGCETRRQQWRLQRSSNGYGQQRKMKNLREVAIAGSVATRKGNRSRGKEEASDDVGMATTGMIATGKRGGKKQQRRRLQQRTVRLHGLQATDRAAIEVLGSTSKGR
ncbi:hypothetical protein GW17_00003978 [Ensete ventricosum]|nr:hypothetical protein GW17_00003978 [Ensete ventricosum]